MICNLQPRNMAFLLPKKEMSHARPGTLKVSCCRSTQRRGTQDQLTGCIAHNNETVHCELKSISQPLKRSGWRLESDPFFLGCRFFCFLSGLYVFQCFSLECSWKSGQLRRTVYWCIDVLTWNWNWRPH